MRCVFIILFSFLIEELIFQLNNRNGVPNTNNIKLRLNIIIENYSVFFWE